MYILNIIKILTRLRFSEENVVLAVVGSC